jgi:hypothetical protein
VILVLFAYIIHIGFRTGGFWGGLGVAVLFPLLLGMSMAIAPIYALNDATTALFLLAGAWQFWRPMQEHRVPDTREWILSGVFLASAVAAKIVVILFAGPLVLFVILSLLMRHGWRQTVRPLIIFLLVAVLCYLPWLIRGFIYAGNPLIHLFQDLLPVREEFEPVLRGYRREPRTFPFDADGLREAFTRGLWFKAYSAAQLRDALFFIVPLAGLAGAVARSHPLRSTGFAIIAAWLVLPFLHGYNELLRYYTICYVLAVPLLAIWFCAVAGRVRHDVMALVILVLLAASTYNYASRQLAWAGMRTVNWNFRPVLTESHRMEWTRHVENGSTYRLYHKLQPIIDEDALVLVADAPGVAYLRRRALWADYSCGNLIEDWWNGISAQEMHAGLRERGVDFVVYTLSLHNDPRFPEMESAGLVERVPIDEPGATLWRVVSGSE